MATTPIVIDPNSGDITVDDLTGLIPAVGPSAPGIITAQGIAQAVAGTQPAASSTSISPVFLWLGVGLLFLMFADSGGKRR